MPTHNRKLTNQGDSAMAGYHQLAASFTTADRASSRSVLRGAANLRTDLEERYQGIIVALL